MAISDILSILDSEILKLKQERALLTGSAAPTAKKKAGRPRKLEAAPAMAAAVAATAKPAKKKKRKLTPEGRKRIAEAVKRRWAAQKKAAGAAK
jgi:hypothetical protein